jgi:hypothetical protein
LIFFVSFFHQGKKERNILCKFARDDYRYLKLKCFAWEFKKGYGVYKFMSLRKNAETAAKSRPILAP